MASGLIAGGPMAGGLGEPPEREPYSGSIETHTSVVFLAGAWAFKVKKPVRLPFLDLSRWQDRVANCEDEVRLNRRIAADVYLGVGRLTLPGGEEPVVVMRRMPVSRRLSRLVTDGSDVTGAVQAVARQLAVMHAREPAVRDYDLPETLTALWLSGREQLAAFEDDLAGGDLDGTVELALEYLRGRRGLLADRERHGHVRDGHGDLLTDDIFCLDDGPRILDCLEFDPRLRIGDVLADAAFLAMDLYAHGRPDLAAVFLDRYRCLVAERAPRSLVDHFIAYRAFVRVKVECLRRAQGDVAAGRRAGALLRLCRERLEVARVRLVLVGGLPGSGKSTLARALAGTDPLHRQWALLSSDRVRKELVGLPALAPRPAGYGTGLYAPGCTDATYRELVRRARTALEGGVCAVLDASWTAAGHRETARRMAASAAAAVTEVECRADLDVCRQRLARRVGPHPSDADPGVLAAMAARAAPWPQAHPITTQRPKGEAAGELQRLLGGTLDGRGAVEPARG